MSNSEKMSTVESLRKFVNERLTAAAEEILGVFEKTVVVYEEEIDRQRRLLDIVLKPQIKLHRTDLSQPSVCKEELLLDQQHCNQESKSSLGQEVPEPPQIKEEQEELCSSQEGEQPSVQEEADVLKLTRTSEGSDHSEHESLHSDPDQSQSAAEEEPAANISFRLIKPEAGREDSGVSEPNSDRRLRSHNHHVAESEGYQTSSCGNAGSTQRTEPKQQSKYKCVRCSKEFSRHRCGLCGKEFTHGSSLKQHMRSHTGEKPYKCHLCGKGFAVKYVLKRHTRIHTGERPFECSTCGKVCSQLSNLKIHMRTHTGERPFRCSTCGKAFAVMATLKNHLKTHTGAITI